MEKFERKKGIGENGLTLVEVLAALVILGIVFISFMTLFPQMTNLNAKTEAKLETMNLARKELASVKSGDVPAGFLDELKKPMGKVDIWTNTKPGEGDYTVEVDYYTSPDLKPENPKSVEGQITLYKVHIKILKAGQKISETFGYIELET